MERQYAEPDRSNPNNYMLDSCVYGTLAEDEELLMCLKNQYQKNSVIILQQSKIWNL